MIDLNSSDLDTLVRELEISPRLAKRIIGMRPFRSVADLQRIWGVDPETLARLTPLVMASPPPAEAMQGEAQLVPPEIEPASEPLVGPALERLFAKIRLEWKLILVLGAILLCGAYFRFIGLNWDQNRHQHPDERAIAMMAEPLRPIGLFEYLEFDTQNSPLNPTRNGSYTYGMLPLFLTRYIAEWIHMADYDRMVLVGRALSGLFDLAVVLALYLLGARLYSRRVGLLAAALSAAAVLPIQLSHYWTVDSFSTVFVVAGFYFAVRVAPGVSAGQKPVQDDRWSYALFGLMNGLAMACKVNTLPLFGVIVVAGLARVAEVWRQPAERNSVLKTVLKGWLIAAVVAAVAFRVFQPYAFSGPGFFGLKLDQRWLDIMREVTNQVAGKSEWPPNHHWTSRPFTYAWTNLVVWGMGLPLGLTAWLGLVWTVWRCWKGDWRRHLLPIVWVVGYFAWQNSQFWRYMRYFLPIYPLLILLAAWALIELLDRTRTSRQKLWDRVRHGQRAEWSSRTALPGTFAGLAVLIVVVGTFAYAFAFTRIYTRPHTRVTASRWILKNVPGPLNVIVNSPQGSQSYPLSVPRDLALLPGQPSRAAFQPLKSGTVTEITTGRVRLAGAEFGIKLSTDPNGNNTLAEGHLIIMAGDKDTRQTITFPETSLESGPTYYLHYLVRNNSPLTASELMLQGEADWPLNGELTDLAPGVNEGSLQFTLDRPLRLNRLVMGNFQMARPSVSTTLEVKLARDEAGQDLLADASVASDSFSSDDGGGQSPTFSFPPVDLRAGDTYFVIYQVTLGGPLTLSGDTMALETSWDDALPLGVDGLDPLGGIYAPFNFELYEPDTVAKREKMLDILSQTDYIIIPSNRAYDAMPRLPLRYPLTLKYYQALFGCECSGDAMEARAYQAIPPLKGPLGFELAAVFESDPNLGPFSISDQTADESFTVYDHPKVLIFKKSPDFTLEKARAILESVDLTQVLDQAPMAYTQMPTGLLLPPDRLAAQQAGGTWSEMFDYQSILNRDQTLGGVAWYLMLLLLSWLAFPLVFAAFPGLQDRGYPLARIAALLFAAWLAWILGSFKILPFTQGTLWLSVGALAVIGGGLAAWNRKQLAAFVRARWRYLLGVESLFMALFLFDLAIRLGNPDLWHPWLGGEKPMDFAFFNAVLKTVYFPPANPWFSGHYINYYYYGYVIAAVLTKLLGIVPSIAFNLILPTWFAMVGVGVFCVTLNLVAGPAKALLPLVGNEKMKAVPKPDGESGVKPAQKTDTSSGQSKPFAGQGRMPYLAGIFAVILMLLLGNLYQVRQLWQYLPEVAGEPGQQGVSILERAGAVVSGAGRVLSGQAELPGDKGRWYFGPSRPILHDQPDTPIAEFPFFTFLYADLHPHLLAMPVLFAALAWALSFLFAADQQPTSRGLGRWPGLVAVWFVAGLVFGVFRPTHTWDFPTMVGLGALAVVWGIWRTRRGFSRDTLLVMAIQVGLLAGVAVAMYYPFSQWFGTEYTSLELWKGARTSLGDYLTVHGLFLFILISFLIWETRLWFKERATWLSRSFGELMAGIRLWMILAIVIVIVGLLLLWKNNYQVLTAGLPLLAWVGLLLMRKDQSPQKRIVLGLLGVGVAITMGVEVVVLQGDVGRSNTVFRFYNQVWALFSVAAGATLVWMIPIIRQWSRQWRESWLWALALLVLAAASYTVIATPMKMDDRWPGIANPPHNLDGMAYMLGEDQSNEGVPGSTQGAVYKDEERPMNLASDYAGIRFAQDHIAGTPTLVEGYTSEYRWGARYSIYTGLPAVIGWNWHVRQHNSILPASVVENRIEEVNQFYNTPDPNAALEFLRRYHVNYIVVGDLERVYYSAEGLSKFQQMVQQGMLQVASGGAGSGEATIYRVLQ